eukprot:6420507-Amphidinium_carterae.1
MSKGKATLVINKPIFQSLGHKAYRFPHPSCWPSPTHQQERRFDVLPEPTQSHWVPVIPSRSSQVHEVSPAFHTVLSEADWTTCASLTDAHLLLQKTELARTCSLLVATSNVPKTKARGR